eukprot:sb/3476899/
MLDKENKWISNVYVMFYSSMQYIIRRCTISSRDLPVQPPVEVDKIWKITKTETAIIITCNDVEVVNFLFADSSNSACTPALGGDVVEHIKFLSSITPGQSDTASDFYKAGITS